MLALLAAHSPNLWFFYLSGSVVLVAGLLTVRKDLLNTSLMDKLLLLGPLFFAIPLAVFGTQHFIQTAAIMGIMPSWIPEHLFFVLLVGACLIAAALSIATRIRAALAAFLAAVMFLCFEALMIIPSAVANPRNRFNWVIVLREFTFCAGALSIAAAQASTWSDRARNVARTFARLELGVALVFFAMQQFLHPAFVPGVPLELRTPGWIPGHSLWAYVTGLVYLPAGLCLIANRRARSAALAAGTMLLVLVVAVYLPMLVAKPFDIEAIDYFFDTLLLSGSALAVAAIQPQAAAGRPDLSTSAKTA